MRRFGRAFLTVSVVLVLLVNLIVILLYGRQFYACPDPNGGERTFCGDLTSPTFDYWPAVTLNAVVIGTLLLIWLAVVYYRRQTTHAV